MSIAETVKMEIGYEDDGTIIFVDVDKEDIQLVRKALTYLHKQEQEEKKKLRALASTCRNCKYSKPRDRYDSTLVCTQKKIHKYYNKVVRPTESCEMFERREDLQ